MIAIKFGVSPEYVQLQGPCAAPTTGATDNASDVPSDSNHRRMLRHTRLGLLDEPATELPFVVQVCAYLGQLSCYCGGIIGP